MDQFLKSLTARRTILEGEMAAERGAAHPDGERLLDLKRMKRQIGMQIDYIRREGRQIAEVMVVRKRRRFAPLGVKSLR